MSGTEKLLHRLAIEHPIIQAPMAGVSTPELAASVSNAGGLGSLGIGASSAAQALKAIDETRALTTRPINVNVFCHQPAKRDSPREGAWIEYLKPLFDEVGASLPSRLEEIYKSFLEDTDALQVLLKTRPEVVSFHFGLPDANTIGTIREAGIFTMATATNLREARAIEAAGVGAIVAQGIEAGGHRGMFDPEATDERLSTFLLVRLLVSKTHIPIIAAGGIMDGQGIKAMLQIGAAAAQLGTAFILCPESAANESYRANLKAFDSEPGRSTRLTPTLSGRPARGIVNRYIEFAEAPGAPPPAAYPLTYDAAKQLNAAASKSGNFEFAAQWSGQGAALARELPAAQLVELLVEEMNS